MNSEKSETFRNKNVLKKSRIIFYIIKYFVIVSLAILLIIAFIAHIPHKIIALLAVLLVALTILPKKFRKRFWLTVSGVALTLVIWILFPENNTDWHPYTFDKEISAFENKFIVPDNENAAFIYKETFKTIDADSNQPDYFTQTAPSSLDGFWFAHDHPEMAEWIQNYKNTIENIKHASNKENCLFPFGVTPETYYNSMEILPSLRYCVFLNISSANNDIAEGRTEDGIKKYFSNFGIAKHLAQQPMLPSLMASFGIKEKTLQILNRFIIENKPDTKQLETVSNTIGSIENKWSSDWLRMLEFEKLYAKNAFAYSAFDINKSGKLRFSRLPLFFDEQSFYNPQRDTYFYRSLGKIRALLRWFYLPSKPQQLNNVIESAFVKFYKMAEPDFDWDEQNDEESAININYLSYVKFLINENEYNYRQIHQVYLNHLTLLRGSILLLALRQYKDEHGYWPDSLDGIKSDTPAEAFIDPATGKQLQYEKSGEDFTLSGELINIWPFDSFD